MTKKLVWRLGKLPSVEELQGLVKDKIITQDEAREILFSSEDEVDRDKKSLQSEIKFLRDLVESLSNNSQTVEIIRKIEKPYTRWEWYRPYEVWSSNVCNLTTNNTGTAYFNLSGSGIGSETENFSSVKTF